MKLANLSLHFTHFFARNSDKGRTLRPYIRIALSAMIGDVENDKGGGQSSEQCVQNLSSFFLSSVLP
jgi:hypothetical protein